MNGEGLIQERSRFVNLTAHGQTEPVPVGQFRVAAHGRRDGVVVVAFAGAVVGPPNCDDATQLEQRFVVIVDAQR